jgi:hypothetical protein
MLNGPTGHRRRAPRTRSRTGRLPLPRWQPKEKLRSLVYLTGPAVNSAATNDGFAGLVAGYLHLGGLGLHRCGGRVVAGRPAQSPLACIDSPRPPLSTRHASWSEPLF